MEGQSDSYTIKEIANIKKEFKRLKDKTYLDNAGAALYSETQLKCIMNDLTENLYLNPHTSKYTNDCVDQIRYDILKHFNTDSVEYSIIFTSGATASLKLIAESFTYSDKRYWNWNNNVDSDTGAFVYLQDNHTSVLGMRDLALQNNASVIHITRSEFMHIMSDYESSHIEDEFHESFDSLNRALFVFPAQCNFNGFKYPLKWIDYINNGALNEYTRKKFGRTYSEWITVLDAAAYVSTNNLDLSVYKPKFACVSFYKIFGYPTGLGALIVHNSCIELLNNKKYYGGGTVEIAISKYNHHVKRQILHERFEDGSISFLSILSMKHGFNALESIFNETLKENIMKKISKHTFYLSKSLFDKLRSLRHENGNPVAKLYNDSDYNNIEIQGGIVNFNILRANGEYIGYAEVVHMAELFNVYIRSGCFCNPGACQRHLNLSNEELIKHHRAGHKCGDNNDLIDGIPTGSIRVSFGYMNTMEDVLNLMNMILKCFVEGEAKYIEIVATDLKKSDNTKKLIKKEIVANEKSLISIDDNLDINNFIAKGKLLEIYLYPIKSCAAFKITQSWSIGTRGLKYDREWMIVSENGVPLTQKQDTRMCLIKPFIDLEKNILKLSFSGVNDITVPLDNENYDSNVCHSKICGDRVRGFDCGDSVADWLTDVLGLPNIRLIKQTDSRITNKHAKDPNLSLTNQAQYLMVNIASVKWLAEKVKSGEFNHNIDNLTQRFRGNLIIETDCEFDEFTWKSVTIGSNMFKVDGPCTRCQMICIDQESGDKTTEPLRTISKEQGKLHFGIYLSNQINKDCVLKCGDKIMAKIN